ncbi:glyoxalase [Bradyrhizobium elkanii]|jgi:catechol 2,3-dioxygenase-like lactoylglutathione lyase family enzyme|nr:glyoxalase [Bradyrhizobium elkanii]NWL67702.1 glyoxalase [Bradyrhizobium elkanii]RYM17042.1 glyoxalase [Bradyrhizobium elkanii]UQD83854.1 VOC family protein [Bradyrhizobium elkanii USDA 76]GEC53974.1 glyoxalase [Bradyrhizobium elkanii]
MSGRNRSTRDSRPDGLSDRRHRQTVVPTRGLQHEGRIVANVAASDTAAARSFYRDLLGLEPLMDFGWVATYGSSETMQAQISFASEGGSGTPVPDLSIEVDDLDEALRRMKAARIAIEYGPADEPWGVRRFFVRDPFGKLINILEHRS